MSMSEERWKEERGEESDILIYIFFPPAIVLISMPLPKGRNTIISFD